MITLSAIGITIGIIVFIAWLIILKIGALWKLKL